MTLPREIRLDCIAPSAVSHPFRQSSTMDSELDDWPFLSGPAHAHFTDRDSEGGSSNVLRIIAGEVKTMPTPVPQGCFPIQPPVSPSPGLVQGGPSSQDLARLPAYTASPALCGELPKAWSGCQGGGSQTAWGFAKCTPTGQLSSDGMWGAGGGIRLPSVIFLQPHLLPGMIMGSSCRQT